MQAYEKAWQWAKIHIRASDDHIKKLEFMVENGLGWEDMENDCYPSGDQAPPLSIPK